MTITNNNNLIKRFVEEISDGNALKNAFCPILRFKGKFNRTMFTNTFSEIILPLLVI
ncbi:hypothetical protein Pint_17074 [Pistacia integerrima]|uniref:Uncharacterized protein n=1 Tax=Pistacia integerrima TaxID=434235 RepID=A0ACC0ZDC6_9ROSI|nr:hypothetical protein Pint_17074 [Pistacia integerrima]